MSRETGPGAAAGRKGGDASVMVKKVLVPGLRWGRSRAEVRQLVPLLVEKGQRLERTEKVPEAPPSIKQDFR